MISVMMPAAENIRGTSALPYHLLVDRDKDIDIELYSYNLNQLSNEQIESVAKDLNIKIHLLPVPWWYTFILKYLSSFRLFLKYPIGNYICLSSQQIDKIVRINPDGIWIYGEELSRVSMQLKEFKRIHTLPDCESLYYYRMLGKRFAMQNKIRFWRSIFMYPKYLNMEKKFDTSPNVHYHLVGEADMEFLQEIKPGIQAHFIRHPHYQVALPEKTISFSSPKIKVLIAGQYDLYMQQDADEMITQLSKENNVSALKEHYQFTFLGKGWEQHAITLRNVGYDVCHIKFAPNYIEEITKYDIQITPICIGTGTKGKVLDAIANGLLVIGTPFALENIAVRNQESCVEYNNSKELIDALKNIPLDREFYENLVINGRNLVLTVHNRKVMARQLFNMYLN